MKEATRIIIWAMILILSIYFFINPLHKNFGFIEGCFYGFVLGVFITTEIITYFIKKYKK